MSWTKGKVEKAWRIFMKASDVIADALDVPAEELRALLLEGTLPNMEAPADTMEPSFHGKRATRADLVPPDPEEVLESAAPIIDEPIAFATTPPFDKLSPEAQEAVQAIVEAAATKLLDPALANPALREAYEEAHSTGLAIIEVSHEVTADAGGSVKVKKLPQKLIRAAALEIPAAGNTPPGVDVLMGGSAIRPQGSRTSQHPPPPPPRPKIHAGPAEFYLMHDGKYLHESCQGLTDKKAHAWRQPENKIAAVRRKFPETVDYVEVQAK